jgi:hypothetical protein
LEVQLKTLQKLFAALLQTEETILPIFIHNPKSQTITGAVLETETIFGQIFGLTPPTAPTA